jgi:hypothetical protein
MLLCPVLTVPSLVLQLVRLRSWTSHRWGHLESVPAMLSSAPSHLANTYEFAIPPGLVERYEHDRLHLPF